MLRARDRFDVHDAVRALQNYVDCYAASNEGDGTDIDSLWATAEDLVIALGAALERLVEVDPVVRKELSEALAAFDKWAIDRTADAPEVREVFLTTCLSERRMASLPQDVLTELLTHEDRVVRLAAIKALGISQGRTRGRNAGR